MFIKNYRRAEARKTTVVDDKLGTGRARSLATILYCSCASLNRSIQTQHYFLSRVCGHRRLIEVEVEASMLKAKAQRSGRHQRGAIRAGEVPDTMLLLIGVSDPRAHTQHQDWRKGVSTCNFDAHAKVPTCGRSAENINLPHVGARVSPSPWLIVISPSMKALFMPSGLCAYCMSIIVHNAGSRIQHLKYRDDSPQNNTSRLRDRSYGVL